MFEFLVERCPKSAFVHPLFYPLFILLVYNSGTSYSRNVNYIVFFMRLTRMQLYKYFNQDWHVFHDLGAYMDLCNYTQTY